MTEPQQINGIRRSESSSYVITSARHLLPAPISLVKERPVRLAGFCNNFDIDKHCIVPGPAGRCLPTVGGKLIRIVKAIGSREKERTGSEHEW